MEGTRTAAAIKITTTVTTVAVIKYTEVIETLLIENIWKRINSSIVLN